MTYKILNFEIPHQQGIYRDSLLLKESVGYTEEQIEAMKQQRLDSWIYALNSISVNVSGIEATSQTDGLGPLNTSQE